jgi:hypothetical protein
VPSAHGASADAIVPLAPLINTEAGAQPIDVLDSHLLIALYAYAIEPEGTHGDGNAFIDTHTCP